jgi:3-phosphoglycerate kinase
MVERVPVAVAGFLMKRELEALTGLLTQPTKPFVAIVGGAKVSDKIAVLESLLERVDAMLVGGAMAYTFLAADGHRTGASRVEKDRLETARELLASASAQNVSVELPSDHVCAHSFDENAPPVAVDGVDIPDGLMGLDIGPKTRERYATRIAAAATIFWNGPMGVFEWKSFSRGTTAIAEAVADSPARSVVGGGDSVAALTRSGRAGDITHVSTGGGASLELLEGHTLPGVAALERTKA